MTSTPPRTETLRVLEQARRCCRVGHVPPMSAVRDALDRAARAGGRHRAADSAVRAFDAARSEQPAFEFDGALVGGIV